MGQAPEIPEVEDSFSRKVALSIATIAVILSVVSMKGDNAKGDGLLAATKASSQWAYCKAESIKRSHVRDSKRAALLTSFGFRRLSEAEPAACDIRSEHHGLRARKERDHRRSEEARGRGSRER